ncbi:MAG: hypothetical protein IT436_13315 [Phycisphaerales bacterium]|nr:hypothetical protein [Phycisphaerales bacterium]
MITRSMHSGLRTVALLAAGVAVTAATLGFAEGPDRPRRGYNFQTIDVPFGVPGEDFDMQILWVNDAGIVTAQYQSPRSPDFLETMHTAILRGCEWTVIDVPAAATTGGSNANARGQVVLSHHSGNEVWHAAIRGRRGLTAFPDIPEYPGGIITQGVNDRGQIAAVVTDADGVGHAFFGDTEQSAVVSFPGADVVYTQGNMINNAGVGVGTYISADGFHAFKWKNGQISNIDPPAGLGTEPAATSINNWGVIVGIWLNPQGAVTGYVHRGDQVSEFAVPDSTYTLPYFINDRGQISGIYGDADGVAHGFVATPRRP